MQIIFIIGFMASGKSTFGRKLALDLFYDFVDLDEEIENEFQESISDFFKHEGEDFFRQIEHSILKETINGLNQNTIFSCGGGTPFFYDNFERMKRVGKVIFLHTNFDVILERLKSQNFRPLYKHDANNEEKITSISLLYETRLHKYLEADLTINEQNQSLADIKMLILKKSG